MSPPPEPGSPVRVVYRKYDGSLHWHAELARLGADEHGVWLGSPANGSSWRRGAEPPHVWEHAYVMLVPRGVWWTATFNSGSERRVEIYCDITTVPEWYDDEVTMIDLDLDVIRRRDGAVYPVDEDEFAEHRVRYGYPPDIADGAEASMAWLLDALGNGTQPFGRSSSAAYLSWLARVDAA